MITRRNTVLLMAATMIQSRYSQAFAQNLNVESADELLSPTDSPQIDDLTKIQPFGSHPATQAQIRAADNIIANMPTGPRPLDIAQAFYTRYYNSDPHAISEWPRAEAWNPLIARFFEATSLHTKQDTVAWCAAFVNWCLERAHRPATRDSGSQSFARTELFDVTTNPVEGDIAVFTCYEKGTDLSYGIGHVTFFKNFEDNQHFLAIGGNQSGKTPSIICEKRFPMRFASSRTVNGQRVPVDYRVNRFLHVV